jgi:hypothetical protein
LLAASRGGCTEAQFKRAAAASVGARHHDHMCRMTNTIHVTMSAISSRE